MYLKSLEVHGFKSFANKIVFDFHNGITGIVGPNGSGKSNVADAVRWVLGEQSTKQLRGSTMQDVIFAGTENRKPLSYAYVAITLDNSDHQLAIDFEEVTIARRLYRSGESEYLINGHVCRLKEVTELFYDTGIGKEGYSIIGQGQIDRILSGKPEERRELFDEAAGIVKYKKRKLTAQKKLDNERENLVRVKDILSELERQVGPLERQSEKAKIYLKKKEELKELDINMFLLEMEHMKEEEASLTKSRNIASYEMREANTAYEKIKFEYERLEQAMQEMEETINSLRENLASSSVTKEKLESQIQLLTEQIHTAELSEEHLQSRLSAIEKEKEERKKAYQGYDEKRIDMENQILSIREREQKAQMELEVIQVQMAECSANMERDQAELIQLLKNNASIKGRKQRCDTMLEQIQIRKGELNKRILNRKTEEEDLSVNLASSEAELTNINEELSDLRIQEAELLEKVVAWKKKDREHTQKIEDTRLRFHKQESRLESLRNIAERYDGYGNSIRKVMEQKSQYPGILGVVSDLIQVEKKYEIAIETALGGNIQNVVTKDEETAREMIAFLKANRYGRVTFLPLTSVTAKGNPRNESALHEHGVIGIASELVQCEEKYREIASYLLGRVLVVDTIEHALAIARKHQFLLHIVTLEGEYLSPGGSMTGGAFKNASNLLARNREIEELENELFELQKSLEQSKSRQEDIVTALVLNEEELTTVKSQIQELVLRQNTAQMNLEVARQQKNDSDRAFSSLLQESKQIEQQIAEIQEEKQKIQEESAYAKCRRVELEEAGKTWQARLEEQREREETAKQAVSQITVEEAYIRQNIEFIQENIARVQNEIARFDKEKEELIANASHAKDDIEKKLSDIEEIRKTIAISSDAVTQWKNQLAENLEKKEQMSEKYRGFFKKQEEVSQHRNNLDKELMRLDGQLDRLHETEDAQLRYMWEEYEITPHTAVEHRKETHTNRTELKKGIVQIKDEIRKLGDVNVNAIEEYKEISERYQFLKTQHDDLIQAEQTLLGIIEDLDVGMRKQFEEKFAEIQREFDASFRQLFGGGHGTLQLVEDEDILECGIRIIAQPPGKKLQNMMQLSGGEKALTAIALLFAIQVLKPSPFCLLDEIEAALDDSNVTRFAQYLNRLTKNTQYIVITHRRGTMTAADRLYGITMQEKGVSALVSVNLIEDGLTE